MIAAGAVRSVLRDMIDDYAKQSGHRFDFTIGSTGRLREVIASGEPADILITAGPLLDELEKTGKMRAGSRVDLGRIGLGIVLRDGFTKADVATADGVRQAILAALLLWRAVRKLRAARHSRHPLNSGELGYQLLKVLTHLKLNLLGLIWWKDLCNLVKARGRFFPLKRLIDP